MAQTMTSERAATGSKSLGARIIGVVIAPRATYADVGARPRVFGALVFVLAVIVAATFVFLSTEVGQQASLDNQVRQLESFGRTVSDQQYQQMERMAPYSRYFAAGFQLEATKPVTSPPLGTRVKRWLKGMAKHVVRMMAGAPK